MRKELKEFAIQKIEFMLPLLIEDRKALEEEYNQLSTVLDKIFEIIRKEKKSDSRNLKPLKDMFDIYFYKNIFCSAIEEDFLYLKNREADKITFFKNLLLALKQNQFNTALEIIIENKNIICSSITQHLPNKNQFNELINKLKVENIDLEPIQKELNELKKKVSLLNINLEKDSHDKYDSYMDALRDEIEFFLKNNKPQLRALELKYYYRKKYKKEDESLIEVTFNNDFENIITLKASSKEPNLFKFFEFLILHEGEFVNHSRLIDVQVDILNKIEGKKLNNLTWKSLEEKITQKSWQLQAKVHNYFLDYLNIYFIDSATYFKQKSIKVAKDFNYHSKYELKAYRLRFPNEIFDKTYTKELISFKSKF